MNPQFWWYVSRASGMVAAVLLALTVVWGLLASTRLLRRPGLPAWILDLHRGLGALSVVFVAVHLASLVADDTVHFAWAELFVPFASAWRRGPVALGVGAFWGLVVVQVSSLLQRQIGRKRWKQLHYVSYPVALLTAVHASTAGTDASSAAFQVVSIASVVLITALVVVRVLRSTRTPSRSQHRSPPRSQGRSRASTTHGASIPHAKPRSTTIGR